MKNAMDLLPVNNLPPKLQNAIMQSATWQEAVKNARSRLAFDRTILSRPFMLKLHAEIFPYISPFLHTKEGSEPPLTWLALETLSKRNEELFSGTPLSAEEKKLFTEGDSLALIEYIAQHFTQSAPPLPIREKLTTLFLTDSSGSFRSIFLKKISDSMPPPPALSIQGLASFNQLAALKIAVEEAENQRALQQPDPMGFTATHWAAMIDNVEMLTFLHQQQAPLHLPTTFHMTPVAFAIFLNYAAPLAWFAGKLDLTQPCYKDLPPLHYAASIGQLDAVKLLLEKGAPLVVKTPTKVLVAAACAAQNGWYTVVEALQAAALPAQKKWIAEKHLNPILKATPYKPLRHLYHHTMRVEVPFLSDRPAPTHKPVDDTWRLAAWQNWNKWNTPPKVATQTPVQSQRFIPNGYRKPVI